MPVMGNLVAMQCGFAYGVDGAAGATRRVLRLLALLGLAAAAYLAMSLFDHAARADVGVNDPTSLTKVTDTVSKKVKSTASKARPVKALKTPKPIAQVSKKVHAARSPAPTRAQTRQTTAGKPVHKVQVRTSTVRKPASDAVRGVVRGKVHSAPKTIVRQATSALDEHSTPPVLADLPELTVRLQTQVPTLPQLPNIPPFPDIPKLPDMPQLPDVSQVEALALPKLQPPALPQLPGRPVNVTPGLAPASAPSQSFASPRQQAPLLLAFGQASDLSGVTHPPAPPSQHPTAPLSPSPGQSTSTGQARDSHGGNAPAMGIVSSSWRPDVTASGCRLDTDDNTRGCTVRYAGPPS